MLITYFTVLQITQYIDTRLTIADRVYGSTFFYPLASVDYTPCMGSRVVMLSDSFVDFGTM